MTRALAIETAGRESSVALVDPAAIDGPVVAEADFAGGLRHAAGLLPLIDRLLRDRGWSPADLAEVYVSAGPGSFTGLRVGITAAKTLAIATGARLVAVPTLSVIVENAPTETAHAVVLLDARRGQVFAGRYERVDGRWVEREPAHLEPLAAVLARAPRPLVLLGEGIIAHRDTIPADVAVTPEPLWRPQAAVVARLGLLLSASQQFVDPDRFVPTYLRKAEAEEKWDAEHGAAHP